MGASMVPGGSCDVEGEQLWGVGREEGTWRGP